MVIGVKRQRIDSLHSSTLLATQLPSVFPLNMFELPRNTTEHSATARDRAIFTASEEVLTTPANKDVYSARSYCIFL